MQIKSLHMENFKGCKERTIEFSEITSICGQNATGKTTVFDAFTWLLFGKDSFGRDKFDIRPLDEDGNQIHNIDITVEAVINHNNQDYAVKKVQREKWTKKRGAEEPELSGNTNLYEIDGYPKSEKEYKAFVDGIINEATFKMLTSPTAFTSLKWQEQRQILMGFVSEKTDVEIATEIGGFDLIIGELGKASTDDIKAKYKRQRQELNDRIKELPVRIDELSKQVVNIDEAETTAQIARIKTDIELAEADLEANPLPDIATLNQKIILLEKERKQLDAEANAARMDKLRELQNELDDVQRRYRSALMDAEGNRKAIQRHQQTIEEQGKLFKELGDKYTSIKTSRFDEKANVCKYCGQPLPQNRADENRRLFDKQKERDMLSVQMEGKKVKANIQNAQNALADAEKAVTDAEAIIEETQKKMAELDAMITPLRKPIDITRSIEYGKLTRDIEATRQEIMDADVRSAERMQKSADVRQLRTNLTELESRMATVNRNAEIKQRIDALTEEQRDVTQKLAITEQYVALVDKFISAKLDSISGSINGLFSGLSFKLFDIQINGGVKECCEVTYDGVPYSNLNTGHRVVAGLEIIRAMQKKYGITAPVFIDNAESINEYNVPAMDCQMVLLKVTEDKELTIC